MMDRGGGRMSDHGGSGSHMGGYGTGLAIGIGGALLQQMTTPPPATGEVAGQPSARKKKTASKANSGRSNGTPPSGERRYVPDEVVTEFSSNPSTQTINQIARRYHLTQLESQNFQLLGGTLYRWRIDVRLPVSEVIRALETERAVSSVQPNYLFILQEQVVKNADITQGDAAQYVLGKLQINQAHQFAKGENILVAIIDSEVDATNPELGGTIVKHFDALGHADKPHSHGTAIAGAIASHGKLMGIAPSASLLAVRAFDDNPAEAKGTSFAIYKGLQWATDNDARVVNMSFSGPPDPALHRMLAAAYEKGIILIAAAGNAGPNSAPLYPAADSNVIAVTATDSDDNLFKLANRGGYITVAAPGVDILAAAPNESYQVTTGTSVAAAHVSGVVALLLERKPSLKPKDVRIILMTSAKELGSKDQHKDFGAGLVNAYKALMLPADKPVGKEDGNEHANR
jgi:subtilisin family serine protease